MKGAGPGCGQTDLFGAVPKPAPKPVAARQRRAPAAAEPVTPEPAAVEPLKAEVPVPSRGRDADAGDGGVADAAALSPAELEGLAATLPDEALARLVLASVRQLRRRLARGGGRAGRPSPALERAVRQLAAELGGSGGGDDY